MTAPREIIDLIERFSRNVESYRSGHYGETQVRVEFINPFFKRLGWDIDNTQGFAEAYKDVINEDAIKVGGVTKAPDYCFRIGGTRKFFLDLDRLRHCAVYYIASTLALCLSVYSLRLRIMYIQSVQLENLKAFKSLNFSLQRPDGRLAGWTVFVGGNASGKSTLLKAAALALMGPEAGRQLLGPTVGWIRQGEKRAFCVVNVEADSNSDQFKKTGRTTHQFEAGVRWAVGAENDTPDFRAIDKRNARGTRIQTADRGPWDPNSMGWFSAGYGPMRRLSGSSPDSIRYAVSQGVVSRYVTLFREDAALSESEEWLRKTHSRTLEKDRINGDRSGWKELLTGVTELLSDGLLPHGMKISRITVDHVFVTNERGLELPMRDISDGCRGVYATILDLLHGMFEVYGERELFGKNSQGETVVTRPGVVLIDEIEAHLHPAWQREIPEWLKTHFPNVQFLVATHSPLIAQAADPNGIFVLPLQDEIDREPRRLSDEEYQKIRLGSAHKTVLGIAFGLKSNRSRWADQQINRWQQLEAKRRESELTPAEDTEYSRLFKQMEFAFEGENGLAVPY